MSESKVGTSVQHYRIVSKLGAGGMGEVYLADDTNLERRVALKIILSELAGDESRVRRFIQEAKAASALNHPNILTVHEIGEVDGSRYIVTEYIKGETLRNRLSTGTLTLRETLDVTMQVAAALSAAHNAGIVHRDIKPENIMIRDDGIVKILDFGLVKLTEKEKAVADSNDATRVKTDPGMVMGTAAYMSPEQARGKETDARTDVWSLGVVLYEMLLGASPFAAETSNDSIASILTKDPAPLPAEVPYDLHKFVRRALQKRPDERYQTIKDFLLDVQDLKRELEVSEEIERSQIPASSRSTNVGITASSEHVTAMHPATLSTHNSKTHAPSSAEYIVTEVKKHKYASLGVLGVLLAAFVGAGAYFYWFASSASAAIKSVAVLPFANVGDDAELEFVADSLAEALINNLSRLPNTKVIARSSSFTFKGKEVDPVEAAQKLGVEAIVSGRVQKRGDDVNIAVEMINVADRMQMWGETYNRKISELQSLQTEIARTLSEKLHNRLTGELEQLIAKGETKDARAYELKLKGDYLARKGGRANTLKSIEYLEQAIGIDTLYANAYAAASISYSNMMIYGTSAERNAYLQKQASALARAMELAPDSDKVINAFGSLKWSEYKWAEAEDAFKRAAELNPNAAPALANLSSIYAFRKRYDEALKLGERVIELDPLRPIARINQLGRLLWAGKYDEVIRRAPDVIALAPENTMSRFLLAAAYERKKMYSEAKAEILKACELDKEDFDCPITLAYIQASSGDRATAETTLKETAPNLDKVSPSSLAGLYIVLGDNEKALDVLEKGFAEVGTGMEGIAVDYTLDPIRDEPRFRELLRKMNLLD